jgi:hypothetical protein
LHDDASSGDFPERPSFFTVGAGSGHTSRGRDDVEAKIGYECAAPAHRDGEGGPDKLTVYRREWAYCPFDARAEGHEWGPSPGLTLSMLQLPGAIRPRIDGEGSRAQDEQRTPPRR